LTIDKYYGLWLRLEIAQNYPNWVVGLLPLGKAAGTSTAAGLL